MVLKESLRTRTRINVAASRWKGLILLHPVSNNMVPELEMMLLLHCALLPHLTVIVCLFAWCLTALSTNRLYRAIEV